MSRDHSFSGQASGWALRTWLRGPLVLVLILLALDVVRSWLPLVCQTIGICVALVAIARYWGQRAGWWSLALVLVHGLGLIWFTAGGVSRELLGETVGLALGGPVLLWLTAARQSPSAHAPSETQASEVLHVLDQLSDAFLIIDPNWRITYANAAAAQTLKQTSAALSGVDFWAPDPALRTSSFGRFYEQAMRANTPQEHQDYYEGTASWIATRTYPSANGLAIYFRTITAQQVALQALEHSEERYRAFIAQSSEGIWRFELEQPIDLRLPEDQQLDLVYRYGYLAECNDCMAQMYGFSSAADLVGYRLGDLLVRDDPHNEAYLRNFFRSDYRLIDAESHERDRHGQSRYFLNNLIGIIENGALVRAWGTQRDITERQAVAAERERVLALAQSAQTEAEAAVQVRDTFLSIASHELRTPITALVGNVYLLERQVLPTIADNARMQQLVGRINTQVARLNQLIGTLLDVARLQEGALILQREPVDLTLLVHQVIAESGLPAGRLQATLPAQAVFVVGDAARLEQVVHNLIQNAVKYSPAESGIDLAMMTTNGRAIITVHDQGVGIPASELPHIFERFYRASQAATRQQSGMGIGLYVVRELVQRHGGTVNVTSSEGAGSTFSIELPLRSAETAAASQPK